MAAPQLAGAAQPAKTGAGGGKMQEAQRDATGAAEHGDGIARAHAELVSDKALQFELTSFNPPDPPAWLDPLLRFISSLAPFMAYVFWGGVIAAALILLYIIGAELMRRLPGKAQTGETARSAAAHYRPSAAHVRALLEEADRLAAEGRFSEAARVLLHRSIEDLERAFALNIGPSLTSREIAQLTALSRDGREVFSLIARAVEVSLFGGRALAADDYARCRSAYAGFASGGART